MYLATIGDRTLPVAAYKVWDNLPNIIAVLSKIAFCQGLEIQGQL
jgi:hypothetical protein